MIIFDEDNELATINGLFDVPACNYVWALNLKIMDYILTSVRVIEFYRGPTFTLSIRDTVFKLPAMWYVLIVDDDTYQLDVVPVSSLASETFHVLLYGATVKSYLIEEIKVLDYTLEDNHFYPSFQKHLMLNVAVSDKLWISCSYSDVYTRFLKNKSIADII
jgi:hypothetical protein